MKDFQGKVAVVTGAASGIGRALAGKSAQEGMKVVLADVEERTLKQAEEELQASRAAWPTGSGCWGSICGGSFMACTFLCPVCWHKTARAILSTRPPPLAS